MMNTILLLMIAVNLTIYLYLDFFSECGLHPCRGGFSIMVTISMITRTAGLIWVFGWAYGLGLSVLSTLDPAVGILWVFLIPSTIKVQRLIKREQLPKISNVAGLCWEATFIGIPLLILVNLFLTPFGAFRHLLNQRAVLIGCVMVWIAGSVGRTVYAKWDIKQKVI
jgi:hypothetical protein